MPKRREGPTKNKQTGYYFFDQVVGFGKDRRRIRYSLKTKDPEKARWLWEQEYRKRWSEYYGIQSPMKHSDISFQDMAIEFVDYEKNIKRIKEWKIQEQRLVIVNDLWKNPYLNDVNKDHLIQLDKHLKGLGRSKATINHYFTLLKSVFNYAMKQKYLTENPIKEIVPYVTEEKRREYSPEEIERILAAAEIVEKNARRGAVMQKYAKRIVLLLLYTGMRTGELLHLKWDNVKDDRIVFKRTETKQKKEKVIPLTDGIKEVLESMLDDRRKGAMAPLLDKDGYIIPLSPGMKQRGAVWMTDLIKKIREHSGIEDFIFHNIRHTVATRMVSEALGRGVGIADIQKILGHSSLDTTMKYVHSDFGRMRKAMNILEEKAKKRGGK